MSPKSHSTVRRVALLIEASRAYARGLVRGVSQYNREHEQWSVFYVPHGLTPPAWFAGWKGDGILARIDNQRVAEAIARTGLPVVDLRRMLNGLNMPTMGPDDAIVARLSLEHLRERGFRNLAYFGLWRGAHRALDARSDHFHRFVKEAGLPCATFNLCRRSSRSWEEELTRIIDWIQALPKPVGVMACNDDCGLQLLDACHRADIRVPDEVAVIGVGNDDCICNLSLPTLSSVDLNPRRIGYEAAALLDRMMAGQSPPAELDIMVEPRGIETRVSTDVLAGDDQLAVRAVMYIRAHAYERIQVADVLKHMTMSRAALEPRVRNLLGHTIYQEIQRVRIERVKTLLASTNVPLKQIAAQTGFFYPAYMMRLFRQTTGQTPTEYRQNTQ